jgi:hypothetical protein
VVLLIVVVLWSIVLGPLAWQARADARKTRSVEIFRRRLARLAPPEPLAARPAGASRPAGSAPPPGATVVRISPPGPPPRRSASRPRPVVLRWHRRAMAGLLTAMAGTLVLGILPPLRGLWGIHLALDAAFAVYVAVLRHRRGSALEASAKVRYLPPPEEAEPALRRSATS